MGRFTLLAGALGVVTATLAVPGRPAQAADQTSAATVEVQGTLLVARPDHPGSRPTYAVALAGGDLVSIRGRLASARPLSHFAGRLALPGSVVSALSARGTAVTSGARLGAASDPGREALRVVGDRSLTLRVAGTPTLTDRAGAVTPTVHRQFVAALSNRGHLRQDDQALLGHVRKVGSYWKSQANGAISRIDVPATVTRYKTALSAKDCGLGSDFFDVVREAAAKFPGIDLTDGSDQLVLFVSPDCASGGGVGEGTIGSSFASGGVLIVKAGTAIDGTYAHESGHNYGFNHANARYAGSSMEYYGAYDVMSFALSGYNQLTALSTPFRVYQRITDAGEIRDVALGNRTRAVRTNATIRPRSSDFGLRSVRVVDPDTGRALYLDYRSGTGEDAGGFYTARHVCLRSPRGQLHYAPGITLNTAHDGSGIDTLVVDGKGDTSLRAGSTWTNASGDLSIHVRALHAGDAEVTVRLAPRRDRASRAARVV